MQEAVLGGWPAAGPGAGAWGWPRRSQMRIELPFRRLWIVSEAGLIAISILVLSQAAKSDLGRLPDGFHLVIGEGKVRKTVVAWTLNVPTASLPLADDVDEHPACPVTARCWGPGKALGSRDPRVRGCLVSTDDEP